MKKITNIVYTQKKSIDPDFCEFVANFEYRGQNRNYYIFVEKNNKYKKEDYLRKAKNSFEKDLKKGRVTNTYRKKTPYVILASTFLATAIALGTWAVIKGGGKKTKDIIFDIGADETLELYGQDDVSFPIPSKGTTWNEFYQSHHCFGATKDGYDFLYWSIDGENPIDNNYVFNKSVVLKPIYIKNQDCVTISCRYLDPLESVLIQVNYSKDGGELTYSYNGGSYQTCGTSETLAFDNPKTYISFKSTGYIKTMRLLLKTTGQSENSRFAVNGDINALCNHQEFKDSQFSSVFQNNNLIVSARGLKLPTKSLTTNCYRGMFLNCTSLITAPELPAATVADSCYLEMFSGCSSLVDIPKELPATDLSNATQCYDRMFKGCSSLVEAPNLPATILSSRCYNSMFSDCSALVKVPEKLPATTLINYCYSSMFRHCHSLVKAPELPATTLPTSSACYSYMFNDCPSLSYIKIHYEGDFDPTPVQGATASWVHNVAPTGDFYYNGTDTTRSSSAIPEGWTIHTF